MNIRNIYLLLIVFTVGLSCEKELDYKDLDFEPQLVVNGLQYQDSIITVYVSKTKSIIALESVLPFIENAEVRLYENDKFIETLTHDSLGIYRSAIITKANTEYRIEASVPGIVTAIAEFEFKDLANFRLENISSTIIDTTISIHKPVVTDTSIYKVKLDFDMVFTDNGEEENYYNFKSFGDVSHFYHFGYSSYAEWYEDRQDSVRIEESIFVDISFRDDYEGRKYKPNGRSSYNGYELNRYMDDNLFNGNQVIFELGGGFYSNNPDSIKVVMFSYPHEYIDFHFSGYQQIKLSDYPFAQPMNIYSNVENGLGLVCGVSAASSTIYLADE